MAFENRNFAFATAFVDELARCGLRHACICPGSRSSPLAISLARNAAVKKWVHLDERSAAYFALGMARALREPVALVCTSGTAAANLHPAVAEARNSGVPLLVLTADRPPELWDWGALQTIDQVGLYGSHAKWSVSMPVPEATTPLIAFVRATACRAFATALEPPSGPVHVNFPFREPLEPVSVPSDFSDMAEADAPEEWRGRADGKPFLHVAIAQAALSKDDAQRLTRELSSLERGVIVCGPQIDPRLPEAVAFLARRLGYPILADPLSQVRCGSHDRTLVIDSYDAFLRDADLAASLAPEVVLRFGAFPAPRPLAGYLARHRHAHQILIGDGFKDPIHAASEVVLADPVSFCQDLVGHLSGERRGTWVRQWRQVAEAAASALRQEVTGFQPMFEGRVFLELESLLPEDAILFVGNSMPVRDLETFFPSVHKRVRFLANRGANGIDGVVSSALGADAATGKKVVLVLGDISFYHDMNGLLAAKSHSLDATIIVLNNNGGGIFSFLPQASYPDVFEPYFGTPHGLTFRAAAELYGLGYAKAEDWLQFREAVAQSLAGAGTTIIEVPCDRALNVDLHRRVWHAVAAAAKACGSG
ncbi:MAG: 2-succinyl-5-enolpyruvyl-6-hydroxy-3-cyclohexene-1-carboxylic-acid synthase [Chloroflexi bacterium]|nr:2-succinyl-5-enolpyruvyl-6-hydroxy-3-cyclohexene-1-carboxylic-acid synthase [Chloroflexota bacterium]